MNSSFSTTARNKGCTKKLVDFSIFGHEITSNDLVGELKDGLVKLEIRNLNDYTWPELLKVKAFNENYEIVGSGQIGGVQAS